MNLWKSYIKALQFPFLMSALIFGVSVLNFWKIDFYAVGLAMAYLALGSVSGIGSRYFELTGGRKTAKFLFKMLVEPPAVFLLILGLYYAATADLHWIFIGLGLFLAFIILVIAFSELMREKEKQKEMQK